MRVKYETAKLREIVRKNRDKHVLDLVEAKDNYKKKATEFLQAQQEAVNKGQFLAYPDVPMPGDHTSSYNTALRMLEMGTETTVELDASSFSKLVEDNWEWSRDFVASSNSLKG